VDDVEHGASPVDHTTEHVFDGPEVNDDTPTPAQ